MARKGMKSKEKKKKSPPAKAAKSAPRKAAKSAPRKAAKSAPRKAARSAPRKAAKPAKERDSSRFHEGFGILTLAAALLLGPSLVSVQASDGKLMGPFGLAVGSALNWLMGLTGYLLVGALVVIALRIFAGGLGRGSDGGETRHSLWRERVGLVIGLLFCSVLLHLIARPWRVGGASAGGIIGELAAEVLCSLLSTAGTWIICLTGLALATVLATNLSWARVGLAVARWAPRLLTSVSLAVQRFGLQLRDNAQALYEVARRAPAADPELELVCIDTLAKLGDRSAAPHVAEFLDVDEELRGLILDKASTSEILQMLVGKGWRTILDDGLSKASQGLTTFEEVLRSISLREVLA